MGSERCRVKSCSSSSSAAAAAVAANRMVRIELEAAEALAGMAHLVMRDSVADSAAKWGSKGKRVSKRLKSESPPADSPLNPVDSAPSCSDLPQDGAVQNRWQDQIREYSWQDRAVGNQQRGQPICSSSIIKPEKAERDVEALKSSVICTTRYTAIGVGRSRQSLTEAEKEARRLRRVLANRESARQTIRRRQVLCEELTRKATGLALENKNLKREKELAFEEFQSLETMNRQLKALMSAAIKTEVEETSEELKSPFIERSTPPSTNSPLLMYNQFHYSQLCWPSMIQSSTCFQPQHGPHNAVLFPSNVPIPAQGSHDSGEQVNPMNTSGPNTPLYFVPCPWFFPLPDHESAGRPQPPFGQKIVRDETSISNTCSVSSSSKTVTHVEDHHFSFLTKVKKEGSSIAEARQSNDLRQNPIGLPPERGGQHLRPHLRDKILMSVPQSSFGATSAVKHANVLDSLYNPDIGATSSKGSQNIALLEKNLEPADFASKKLADSVAAAEARKRRKKLTKLKHIHGRQCRMHC